MNSILFLESAISVPSLTSISEPKSTPTSLYNLNPPNHQHENQILQPTRPSHQPSERVMSFPSESETIPLNTLAKPVYYERITLEIDRRDLDLMSLVIVSRKTLAHSVETIDLSAQKKKTKHGSTAEVGAKKTGTGARAENASVGVKRTADGTAKRTAGVTRERPATGSTGRASNATLEGSMDEALRTFMKRVFDPEESRKRLGEALAKRRKTTDVNNRGTRKDNTQSKSKSKSKK